MTEPVGDPGPPPRVSIHIISYNQEAYIGDALDSCLDQDFADLEIVVSDDGSTDDTPVIIGDYARRDRRIRALLHSDNVGITANCNRGLSACRGSLIAFMGGDDLLLPGKISKQVDWFDSHPDGVLCGHQVEVFYDDGSPPHLFAHKPRSGRGARPFLKHGTFAACSIMVRAESLPPGGFDTRMPTASDFPLWISILAGGGRFGFIPGIHARYRRHGANVSSSTEKMTRDAIATLDIVAATHPQLADDCRRAYARMVHYPRAVEYTRSGDKRAARREAMAMIRLDPFFMPAYSRLLKAL